jgi:formylmethanofuran dehydrogenase subunit C
MCKIRTGLFFSALANVHPGDSFSIITSAMPWDPMFLGFRNSKDLHIEGDAGRFLAAHMKGGRIILEGNSSTFIGSSSFIGCNMEGGTLIIKGDAHDVPYNTGGKVIIEGDLLSMRKKSKCEMRAHAQRRLALSLSRGLLEVKGEVRWD